MADSTKDHRPAWLPLAASAIVVPTALAGLTLLWPRPQIESQLTSAGTQALAAAGFTGANLVLSGRDATISGIPAVGRQRAIDTVQAATGVRIATVSGVDGGAGTGTGGVGGTGGGVAPPAGSVGASTFGLARRGEDIVLSGVVGSEDQRAPLVAAATATAGDRKVVDELTVTAGASLPSVVSAGSVSAATAALVAGAGDLAVAISGDRVTLTGTAADDAARSAAGTAIGGAVPGSTVDNQLAVAAPTPAPSATGTDLDAAAKQQLQSSIAALLAGAPISFTPDSPRLTAPGKATVEKLVGLLKPAPGARLQVDGYVAPGPGDGKLTAQQLSDQRAATVRDALVAGGVPADHITATGKGEDSAATARALGRRVAITVV